MVRSTVPMRRVRSHRHKFKTFITDVAFMPSVGDGWWRDKARMTIRYWGKAARDEIFADSRRDGTSLKYFCADRPAGRRSRSTPNTNDITAAPTRRRVENRQRRPQGHRPDNTSPPPRLSNGRGGARAWPAYVCVHCVRVLYSSDEPSS